MVKESKKLGKVIEELKDDGVKVEVIKAAPPVKKLKPDLAEDEYVEEKDYETIERLGMTYLVNKKLGTMKRMI